MKIWQTMFVNDKIESVFSENLQVIHQNDFIACCELQVLWSETENKGIRYMYSVLGMSNLSKIHILIFADSILICFEYSIKEKTN